MRLSVLACIAQCFLVCLISVIHPIGSLVDLEDAQQSLFDELTAIRNAQYNSGVIKRSTPEVLEDIIGSCIRACALTQKKEAQSTDSYWHANRTMRSLLTSLAKDVSLLREKSIASTHGARMIKPSFTKKYGASQGALDLTPHVRTVLEVCDRVAGCSGCSDKRCVALRADIEVLRACFAPEVVSDVSEESSVSAPTVSVVSIADAETSEPAYATSDATSDPVDEEPMAREMSLQDFVRPDCALTAVLTTKDDVSLAETDSVVAGEIEDVTDDAIEGNSSPITDPQALALNASPALDSSSRPEGGDPVVVSHVPSDAPNSTSISAPGIRAWFAACSPLQRWSIILAGAVAGIGICVAIVYAVKKWRQQQGADEDVGEGVEEPNVVEGESPEEEE